MKKILFLFSFFCFLFGIVIFTHQTFAASCTTYLQSNSCASGPDSDGKTHTGTTFIIDHCGSDYYCFNPGIGNYYTQQNSCGSNPLSLDNTASHINGHTYLVRKRSNGVYDCVADCTLHPNTPHCPSTTTPSVTPSTTPTSGNMAITVVVGFPGIGFNGGTPQHTTRPVTVELYDSTTTNPGGAGTTPLYSASGIVTYDSSNDNNAGYFVSTTPLSFSNVTSGDYQILIKIPRYLYKLAINSTNTDTPTVFTINPATPIVLDPVILSSGDVAISSGQINHLNITDYNIFISCYGSKAGSSSCPVNTMGPNSTNLADLNDDGKVTIVDLNIWLRSLALLQTNQALGCDTGDCQGD